MPPTKRASKVKPIKGPSTFEGLQYPTREEINVPPEDINEYIFCFYGVKSVGKSELCASFPDYLTLMLETRRRDLSIRSKNLQKHTSKEIRDGADDIWKQIQNTTQRWIDDESVKGLNFDSIDLIYECCFHSICASNNIDRPKDAGKSASDIWIEIRDEWASYFDTLAATRLGINFLSHIKDREIDTVDGSKMDQRSPSCAPACLQYIRQACNFIFHMGWHNGKRALLLRDTTNSALVAVGRRGDTFRQPDGKPVYLLEVPDLELEPITGYERLLSAYENKEWDIDTAEEERTTTPKIRKGPARKRA